MEQRPSPAQAPRAWKVRCILLSDDRRLALVDTRIVGPGDRLDGLTVAEVAADRVVLRDTAGRRRTLPVGLAPRGVTVR